MMLFAELPPRWQASPDFWHLAVLGQGLIDPSLPLLRLA